ncbi:hypothetical protein [Catenulispora rubra]|uniref:hypothetical protein n=1 Tax=Catenulispora rubra TaxID=280293 RepID=UPI001892795F|nr:hypothetical protein [Catenulispora rubra]
MQNVKVDQSDIESLRAITDPEPVTDFDTGEVVVNPKTGERTWRTGIAVRQAGQRRPSVIEVKTRSTTRPPVSDGDVVKVVGLVATFWEQNGRAGLAFRAESIAKADETTNTTDPATGSASTAGAASSSAASTGTGAPRTAAKGGGLA